MAFKQQGLQYGTYYSSQPNAGGNKKTKLLVIGLITAVLLGAVLTALTLLSGSSRNDLTLLAARENSLLTLANTSQTSIRNADLSTANSNASVLLTSDVASLTVDAGVGKLPADLVKREADTNAENLKQASLLNRFDITYRNVVLQKVSALITQAEALSGTLSSKKERAIVDKIIVNLQSIEKQFTDLSL